MYRCLIASILQPNRWNTRWCTSSLTNLYFNKHEAEKPDDQKEEKLYWLTHITKCFPSTYYSMIDKYTSSTFGMSPRQQGLSSLNEYLFTSKKAVWQAIRACKTHPGHINDNLTWRCFTKNASSVNMRRQRQYFRDGFAMKLLKLKLQGPSLALAPSKALGGALIMCVTWSYIF
jgi:hypothetical protein